jgi:hypothetical protein
LIRKMHPATPTASATFFPELATKSLTVAVSRHYPTTNICNALSELEKLAQPFSGGNMCAKTLDGQYPGLEALQLIVNHHGDAFRWSLSKKGRIWLTLTHWDGSKYNTSVEVDPFDNLLAVSEAAAVLVAAHWMKCKGGGPREDTWLGCDAARKCVLDSVDYCRNQLLDTTGRPVDLSPEAEDPPETTERSV